MVTYCFRMVHWSERIQEQINAHLERTRQLYAELSRQCGVSVKRLENPSQLTVGEFLRLRDAMGGALTFGKEVGQ